MWVIQEISLKAAVWVGADPEIGADQSVTVSVGTPLCLYGIAYRRAEGLWIFYVLVIQEIPLTVAVTQARVGVDPGIKNNNFAEM